MPQLILKNVSPEQDGRRKIMPSQHEEVRILYLREKSLRKVAAYYEVDKQTIRFIVNPEAYKAFQEARHAKKPWRRYYHKDAWRLTMRKHRAKKRSLGLLTGMTKAL